MIDLSNEILQILLKYGITEKETLENTPARVSKAINELWRGLHEPPPKLAFFPARKGMIIKVDKIIFNSTCEHHLMPFYGECSITLEVNEKTLGLSKFNRIVQYFASKPTIQEKLCAEVFDFINNALSPIALKVEVKAKHTCVSHRGIKDACSDTTSIIDYKA